MRKIDPFILLLLVTIGIAYIYPDLVLINEGKLIETITSVGVTLIFFFYGLKLSIKEIKADLVNWRLHLLIQCCTFVIFPILVLLTKPLIGNLHDGQLWLSFFFLAALPSTVSSSVVMVSIAKGNVPAAIFNASISGLIGVIVTPLWMQIFIDVGDANILRDVYFGLIKEIIIPVVIGLLLQKYFVKWTIKYSHRLTQFDKAVVLLIVYTSFSESFSSGVFASVDVSYLIEVFAGAICLFFLIFWLTKFIAYRVLNFSVEDLITTQFCGSKKSLTHGSVFGKFLFAHTAASGLLFLPLMMYHAFQILVITFIAQKYGKRKLSASGTLSDIP